MHKHHQMWSQKMKTKKKYNFAVECFYDYEIEANTEEEARQILQDKGGFEIQGKMRYVDSAFKEARLTEVNDG